MDEVMYGKVGLPTNDKHSRAAHWVSTVCAITRLLIGIVLVMKQDENV